MGIFVKFMASESIKINLVDQQAQVVIVGSFIGELYPQIGD